MTATTYGRIERGQHTQTRKLQDIADVFHVSLDEVLGLPVQQTHDNLIAFIRQQVSAALRELDATGGSALDRAERAIEEAADDDLRKEQRADHKRHSSSVSIRKHGRKK